ncbi:protease PrsW [Actinomyces sp. 2119]|uniref:PrsW family intramembrane metalloprotease n=1 Tax=Actinomyces sp. 2119 TaxID=2321393 RepID=UPI000E6C33B7|nr:PrsW family intramembrane metalloprotease [Actinomyces sp. 2119]RJF44706.1 protease PrsW [Actinomyces sp. 2119]
MTLPPPSRSWAPRSGYRRPGADLPSLSGSPAAPVGGVHAGAGQGAGVRPPGWGRVPGPANGAAAPSLQDAARWREVLYYVLAFLGAAGLAGMLWLVSGSASSVPDLALVVLLATVPLLVVLAVVFWIDRWEPEPVRMLLVAFLWGAGVSTAVSLLVNSTFAAVVADATGDLQEAEGLAAVVSAPIVEETVKGLGVLVIFLAWRRTFSGAVDGLVYAAVVAAGFAFAENILYFVTNRENLLLVFMIRGLFSPFAHVTFTACTGVAIGLSARRRSRLAWVWWTPVGLVAAVVLHAFWNGVVTVAPRYYLLVEVPFFLACIGMVVWLRWAERMTMRRRLDDYGRAGWFSPQEVMMLTTGPGRSAGRRWARTRGPAAATAMSRFQKGAAELAQLRQQAVDGHAGYDFADKERELLARITSSRQVFLGAA